MPLQGSWIAVVDDDASTRYALKRILRANYWSVLVFESWEELLPLLEITHPACVLLDICLPAPDGFAIQALLRARAERVPVVFLTAHDDPEILSRAGVNTMFLRKPCSEAALLATLCSAVATVETNEPFPVSPTMHATDKLARR
jgi:FixJ family two-component response regulator